MRLANRLSVRHRLPPSCQLYEPSDLRYCNQLRWLSMENYAKNQLNEIVKINRARGFAAHDSQIINQRSMSDLIVKIKSQIKISSLVKLPDLVASFAVWFVLQSHLQQREQFYWNKSFVNQILLSCESLGFVLSISRFISLKMSLRIRVT